jgi:hypothetical protein
MSKAMLTKRERVLRAARFEETDRVPLYDILQNDAIIEHYAAPLLCGARLDARNGAQATRYAVGCTLDMTRMPDGPSAPGVLLQDNGMRVQVEPWTSWIIERPFCDEPGMLEWVKSQVRRAEQARFDHEYQAQFFAWMDDIARVTASADPTGRQDPVVQVIESGVGLTEMYHTLGWEYFTTLMYDYPDLLEEWLEARHQAELRRVACIADPRRIPIALTYDDLAYKNSTLISPKWLRAHWLPRLARLVAAWHQRDALCLFHSDGNLWPVLADLVSVGIDGLNPLEVLAGMTVKAVRERYPRLFLTGGIDVSQLLPLGTPDEVRAACRQAIAEASGRGYLMGSSTELHWDVKLENAIAMFETAWEMIYYHSP